MMAISELVRCSCIMSLIFLVYGFLFGASCLHSNRKCFISSWSSWHSLHVEDCFPLENLCLSVCNLCVPVASRAFTIAFFVSAGLFFELLQM